MPSLGAWPSASTEVLQGEGHHSAHCSKIHLDEIMEEEGQIIPK